MNVVPPGHPDAPLLGKGPRFPVIRALASGEVYHNETQAQIARAGIGAVICVSHTFPRSPYMQAALILVAERFGGRTASSTASAAQWSAYASSLPYPLTSSPLFWSDTQRDMIRGTQLLQSVESYT